MLLQILSLTLPALISGLIMILTIKANILKFLDIPIDNNLKINGIRVFGDNKTYRGPFFFIIVSILVSGLLNVLYFNGLNFVHPVFSRPPVMIGFIFGASYTLGELINSFIKRRNNINPGAVTQSNWKVIQRFFDLTDGVIIMAFVSVVFNLLTVFEALTAAILGVALHIGTDSLMMVIGLKKKF